MGGQSEAISQCDMRGEETKVRNSRKSRNLGCTEGMRENIYVYDLFQAPFNTHPSFSTCGMHCANCANCANSPPHVQIACGDCGARRYDLINGKMRK